MKKSCHDIKQSMVHGLFLENLRILGKESSRNPSPVVADVRVVNRFWLLSLLIVSAVVTLGFVQTGEVANLPQNFEVPALQAQLNDATPIPVGAQMDLAASLVQKPIRTENLAAYSGLLHNAEISVKSLFGLQINTIVIDPGHGGKDPGAVGARGTQEKDLTLDIARRLRKHLMERGNYQVYLTRYGDETISLSERVRFANSNKADLFISIHINSLPARPVNLVETYYFGPNSDPQTMRVTERENHGSDYHIGDFKEIIQEIGNTIKWQESAGLASAIQHSLFSNIQKTDHEVLDWGVKTAPFVVLLGVDSPGVLAEVACITDHKTEKKLRSEAYREQIAQYLEQGITTYLNQTPVVVEGELQNVGQSRAGDG